MVIRGWRQVLRGLAATSVVAAGVALVGAVVAPTAGAAPVPWDCSDDAFLFQSPGGLDGDHLVQQVDLVTGDNEPLGFLADQVNAVGYNIDDDFNYAWNIRTSTVVRIGADLQMLDLGEPAGIGGAWRGINYNAGAFDADIDLVVMNNQNGRWLEIGGTTEGAPVVLRSGVAPLPGANLIRPGDFALVGGVFYGVAPHSTASASARFVSFDPDTNSWTVHGIMPALASGSTYGAAYTDDVHLFVSRNQSGGIYRIDPANPADAFLVADGPISSVNDGARCRTQEVPTLTLVKQVAGRLVPADQFRIAFEDPDGTEVTFAETTGTDTTVSTDDWPVGRGRTYTIRDTLAEGSVSPPGEYSATIACTADGLPVSAPPPAFIGAWTLTIGTATNYVCTITNTPAAPAPSLALVKSVSPSGPGTLVLDAELTYTFVVTNTGNVPVTGVAIDEVAFSGSDPLPPPTCAPTALDPGAHATCTTTYTVTQEDVDATELTNSATATGLDPDAATVTSNVDSTSLEEPAAPALSIVKSALPPGVTHAGEVVTYTFRVTNDGNVTITAVDVVEGAFNGSGTLTDAVCAATSLAPGTSTECTSTYTVTQADMDVGATLANSATATGTAPDTSQVDSDPDTADVVVLQSPYLTLVKTASPTQVDAAGDVVTYSFVVTNDGNVTLGSVAAIETSFTGSGPIGSPTCGAATLAPAASTTCTVDYVVTAADIAAGQVLNTAQATATDPGGGAVSSAEDDAIVGVIEVVALELVKTASPGTVTAVGDAVTFTFVVTNVGNQPISDVAIDEVSFDGSGTMSAVDCPATSLGVGASMTCTAGYLVTDADLALGAVANTAVASGTGPSGARVVSSESTAVIATARALPDEEPPDDVSPDGEVRPAAGGRLPATGADSMRLLWTGAVALVAGVALVLVGRRLTAA